MSNSTLFLPIGVWQRGDSVEAAWIEEPKQAKKRPYLPFRPRPKCVTIPLHPKETLLGRIAAEMNVVPNFRKEQPLIISAVPPSCVWEKSIIVPQKNLTDEECQQHCKALLGAELPVPLDQVWFDYHPTKLKQGTLIEMSAVLIERANEHRAALEPLTINILDSVSHALMRSFQYFEENLPKETIYVYVDDDYSILLQEKDHCFNVLQVSDLNPASAVDAFCERYNVEAKSVCVHTKNETEETNALIAEKKWKQIKFKHPFIAFGLALWSLNFA